MNLLKRMPFGSNRPASKSEQELERASEALTKNDGETLRHFYDKVQKERYGRNFDGDHAMKIARFYGLWLYWNKKYIESEPVWRFAIAVSREMNYERSECYYRLALCLLGTNKPEEADREGMDALSELLPNIEDVGLRYYVTARIARWRCQFRQEAEIWAEYIGVEHESWLGGQEIRTDDYTLRVDAASAYANAGRLRDALSHIQAAKQFASSDAEKVYVHECEAFWVGYLGDRQLAKTRLEEAVRFAGDEPKLQEHAQASLAIFMLDEGSFAETEPLRKAAGKTHLTYSAIATRHRLQGRYSWARKAYKIVREWWFYDTWEEQRHIAICAIDEATLELEAFYHHQPADLTKARRAVERGRMPLQRDAIHGVYLMGLDAALSAIAGDANYATKLIPQVEMQFVHFESPIVQSNICSLLAESYTHLKQYELARDWGERYLAITPLPVNQLIGQEKLANIYEALGDADKAASLRRAVVESGLPIMAVQAAQVKLSGGELKPVPFEAQ